ncbi:MAG TPA: AsmA family protein [Candidatus Udaeobacter sp.]|nr:AsmA family protein [Candidatus Udaeobacter sp.]
MLKKAAWIGFGLVAFLLAAILFVPAFIDLSIFKQTYLPLIEEAIHRRIDVGEVRLTLIPTPSIRLADLKVSDTPEFPDNTFFVARQLQLRLKLWPLLRGHFEVTEFVLEKPVINLLKQPDGTFNYADLADKKIPVGKKSQGKRKPGPKAQEAATFPFFMLSRIRIKDGQLNIETKGQKPVHIGGIDLSLQEFSGARPFPYRASFSYPGLKTISLEGLLSYQEDQVRLNLKETRLKVHDLVLPVEGNVSNLSTVPRVNLSAAHDQVDAQPVFQVLSVFGLAPRETEISGPLGLRMTVSGPSNNLVTQLRGQFKEAKVNGKRALKGNLNGEIFIRLPLGGGSVARRLQGDGKLIAHDGELTNADLVNKIQRVTGMIGLSKDERRQATTFKTLEAEFTLADGLANFKRIYLTNPQIEANGVGTMTLDRPTLNMAVETALSNEASARAGRGRAATFFKDGQGRIVVPLKITGPAENPAVNLDSEKVLTKGMGEKMEKGLGSFFKQLFRKNK